MIKFIIDIFSEETKNGTGKFSAKRFLGVTSGLLACTGSIISGLHWYEISPDIINPMWIFSGSMLGVSILKGLGRS